MHFNSKRTKKGGLPWFDTRSSWEKSSDEYFDKLEEIANDVDDIEAQINYISNDDFCEVDSGYLFLMGRINELKDYIIDESATENKEELLDSLREVRDNLLDLKDDAILYDDDSGEIDDDFNDLYNDDHDDDWEDDDDDWDDDWDDKDDWDDNDDW